MTLDDLYKKYLNKRGLVDTNQNWIDFLDSVSTAGEVEDE